MEFLKKLYSLLLEYLLPSRCISCKSFVHVDALHNNCSLCGDCWQKIDFLSGSLCYVCGTPFDMDLEHDMTCANCLRNRPRYDQLRSVLRFNEHSKYLLHLFKYYDQLHLGQFFAQHIVMRYRAEIEKCDVITYIPMHKLKRLFRLYNQAHILAQYISEYMDIPIYYDILTKIRWTSSQTALSRTARKKNLSGSLDVKNRIAIKGKRVLLVDDVVTTGSTVNHAASVLKLNGAKKVVVVSIARTLKGYDLEL